MKRNLSNSLESWIQQGVRSMGQIAITPLPDGRYELRNAADRGRNDLTACSSPAAARSLSFFDDARAYRPLKTAPTLCHGWSMVLADATELRMALDHFYPAMTALWLSHLEGMLAPVALRQTLERQTGMYAATKRLQDDEGQDLVGKACAASNCMKRILWDFAPGTPLASVSGKELEKESRTGVEGLTEIPLLCHEACNILVAACREVVKSRERAQASAQGSTGAS